MVIFHSYVSLPEGTETKATPNLKINHIKLLFLNNNHNVFDSYIDMGWYGYRKVGWSHIFSSIPRGTAPVTRNASMCINHELSIPQPLLVPNSFDDIWNTTLNVKKTTVFLNTPMVYMEPSDTWIWKMIFLWQAGNIAWYSHAWVPC